MATLAGLPTSSYRLPPRAPRAPNQWRENEQWHERPAVAQFIYLSMLLHAIAILLFGAPPGGSREGRAMWGSLDVRIVAPAAPIAVPAPVPSLEPLAMPKLEREFRPERKFVTPQVVVPSTVQRISPPQMKLDRMLDAPKIEVAPAPAPAPAPPPAAKVAPAPPIVVPAPVSPIVPQLPTVERTLVEPPNIVAPLAQPVAPAVKERAPPPVEVPRVETPIVPALPAAPALPAIDRAPELAPKVAPPPAPVTEPATPKSESPATAVPDAPMSREDLFKPRVPAPSVPAPAPAPPAPAQRRADDYDPTKPAIDLDTARRRAAQIAREGVGQRALLPFPMPAPPERKTKTEEALEKARKPDCRTAYQELGLLAVVPLVANEFGEGSCRW
jgi:hypothetical protein